MKQESFVTDNRFTNHSPNFFDLQSKRKRMGIEPTRHRFGRLTGFENRGGHQTNKHFRDPLADENRRGPFHECYVRWRLIAT